MRNLNANLDPHIVLFIAWTKMHISIELDFSKINASFEKAGSSWTHRTHHILETFMVWSMLRSRRYSKRVPMYSWCWYCQTILWVLQACNARHSMHARVTRVYSQWCLLLHVHYRKSLFGCKLHWRNSNIDHHNILQERSEKCLMLKMLTYFDLKERPTRSASHNKAHQLVAAWKN